MVHLHASLVGLQVHERFDPSVGILVVTITRWLPGFNRAPEAPQHANTIMMLETRLDIAYDCATIQELTARQRVRCVSEFGQDADACGGPSDSR